MDSLRSLDITALQQMLIERNSEFVTLVKEDAQQERIKALNREISSIHEAIKRERDKDNIDHLL